MRIMMYLPNHLIIAGTGTKSGKTTMACRLIEQFRELQVTAVKVSPHFHNISPGLLTIEEGPGFSIYEETNMETSKDTSRMLFAGAAKVFLVLAWDTDLKTVFSKITPILPEKRPVVCESPALRTFAEPGLFVIMTSDHTVKRQDLEHLQDFPHKKFRLEELTRMERIPVEFSNGKWESV